MPSTSVTATTSGAPSASSTAGSTTPAAPASVTVVATHAAATPSGTVVFVVLSNSATPRSAVGIGVMATSANGRPPLSGRATLASIAANATEAVMIRLSVPAGDSIGAVTASVTDIGLSPPSANPFTAGTASFVADPIAPTIDVQVSAATTAAASVLAVCYQGTILVGGGIAQSVTVGAERPTTVQLVAALTDTPTVCRGFAHPV